jgi:hypothetical protein
VLSADSVRMMTTDHTNPVQRDIGRLFLEGQGRGFGMRPVVTAGSVARAQRARVIPATGAVTILLTQVAAMGPVPAPVIREFWRYAADA